MAAKGGKKKGEKVALSDFLQNDNEEGGWGDREDATPTAISSESLQENVDQSKQNQFGGYHQEGGFGGDDEEGGFGEEGGYRGRGRGRGGYRGRGRGGYRGGRGGFSAPSEDSPFPPLGDEGEGGEGGYRGRGRGGFRGRGRGRGGFGGEGSPFPSEPAPIPNDPPFTARIGNIGFETQREEIEAMFSDLKVKEFKWIINEETGKSRGFTFVEFEDQENLIAAIAKSGAQVGGRTLDIGAAYRKERPSRPKDQFDQVDNWRSAKPTFKDEESPAAMGGYQPRRFNKYESSPKPKVEVNPFGESKPIETATTDKYEDAYAKMVAEAEKQFSASGEGSKYQPKPYRSNTEGDAEGDRRGRGRGRGGRGRGRGFGRGRGRGGFSSAEQQPEERIEAEEGQFGALAEEGGEEKNE